MNFDEFKIVYEDIMSNVNHEDIMKIICESSWSLKDEIISLKEVYKKADKNMYLNKRELKLASNNKEAISK